MLLFWFIIIIWASASPFVKQMLICSNGDWAAVATMYNAIAFFILCFIGLAKGEIKIKINKAKFFKLAFLNGFYDIFVLLAIYFCSTIQYAILANYLWPILLVIFLAKSRGEELSKSAFIGCVMGFLGVAVILTPAIRNIMAEDIIGILFGIIAAFLWAGYSSLLEKEHEKVRFTLQGVAQGISSIAAFYCRTFNQNF
jgi:drug/metabolite transporter (DMT)-like permease